MTQQKQQRKHKAGDQVETTVRSWEFGKTPNTGTKYIKISFEGFITKTIWPWSPKAQEHAMKTLEILGFKGSDLSMLTSDNAIDRTKSYLVVIDKLNESKGKIYYEASWINDPNEGGFKETDMTSDELDEYSMDVSGYIAGTSDISEPAATAQDYKVSQDTNFAADNIPF